MAGGLGGIPLAPAPAQVSHGWEAEAPTLRRRSDGCFSQPSRCSGMQQGEHLGDRGTQLHPGVSLMHQGPAQSRHQCQTGQGASSDRHPFPQLVLGARAEGSGTLHLLGGWRVGVPSSTLHLPCLGTPHALRAALWLIPRLGGEPGPPLQGLWIRSPPGTSRLFFKQSA